MKEAGGFSSVSSSIPSEEVKRRGVAHFTEVPSIFTEDLGVFFILNLILLVQPKNVDELKDFFSSSEELTALVDQVLVRMEEFNIVEIRDNRIKILKHHVRCNKADDQLRFLASLFELAINRVLKHEIKDSQGRMRNRETVFWSVLPDDVQVAKELREINCEYLAKLRALEDRYGVHERKSSSAKLRFNGLVNVLLGAEDFE